jgi:putative DNA methylase
MMPLREVLTRRNLPHWFVPGAMHFITYRLAGTIPQTVLVRLREFRHRRLERKPATGVSVSQHKEHAHKQFFAEYDRYLDVTSKVAWLKKPPVAALIRGNLYHHAGSKYHLLAFCVMPNHVHVLLQPIDLVTPSGPLGEAVKSIEPIQLANQPLPLPDEIEDVRCPLTTIMHSLKSYTAHQANKLLGRCGQFWQHESFDHWVRDEEELERIVQYIVWNPVKAKLVKAPQEWYFSSAHDRFIQDGSDMGFLL